MFDNYFNKIIKSSSIPNRVSNKSTYNEWFDKWRVFGAKPNKKAYQIYSHFMGDNVNIVPNDIARNYIEPVLTPEDVQPFYNDKNSFSMFLPADIMPKTYFRSMNGLLYDGDYNSVREDDFYKLFDDAERLLVKPSRELGGKGVSVFDKKDGKFIDSEGHTLSLPYLLQTYGRNFIVQEYLKQSPFMAQFNESSLNTIRIATHRSVVSGEIVILGAFIRIGGKGSIVDNISSGGSSVSIDNNGKLGKYAYDKYRRRSKIHNGINFYDNEFVIPNFEKVKDLVTKVAKCMPHMSLFANDVAIDENGEVKLIEVNTMQFAYTFYQVSGHPAFGEHTDDVIRYCLKEKDYFKIGLTQLY